MLRVLAACFATATLTTATIAATLPAARIVSQPRLVPPCPHPSYGANGNMGPLFCVIDNPLALQYFAPMAKRTFALGPDATPGQVASALVADYRRAGTEPILCSIFQLAQWRNQWRFGASAADQVGGLLRFPADWCHTPRFPGIH